MPSWNSVTCLPSRSLIASLPIKSIRLMWLSRFTRTAWPVQTRCNLFDVRGFSCAVVALNHHAAVMRESLQGSPTWCLDRTCRLGQPLARGLCASAKPLTVMSVSMPNTSRTEMSSVGFALMSIMPSAMSRNPSVRCVSRVCLCLCGHNIAGVLEGKGKSSETAYNGAKNGRIVVGGLISIFERPVDKANLAAFVCSFTEK